MTRKDYVLLANAIGATIDAIDLRCADNTPEVMEIWRARRGAIDILLINLSKALASDNPRFDRDRFAKACEETPALRIAHREEITAQLSEEVR